MVVKCTRSGSSYWIVSQSQCIERTDGNTFEVLGEHESVDRIGDQLALQSLCDARDRGHSVAAPCSVGLCQRNIRTRGNSLRRRTGHRSVRCERSEGVFPCATVHSQSVIRPSTGWLTGTMKFAAAALENEVLSIRLHATEIATMQPCFKASNWSAS